VRCAEPTVLQGESERTRFVRVRICDAGDTEQCTPVQSQTLVPMLALRPALHIAATIVTAEAMGYRPNVVPCSHQGG